MMIRLTFVPGSATTVPPPASQAYDPARSEPDWIAQGRTLRRLEAAFSAVTLVLLLAWGAAVAGALG